MSIKLHGKDINTESEVLMLRDLLEKIYNADDKAKLATQAAAACQREFVFLCSEWYALTGQQEVPVSGAGWDFAERELRDLLHALRGKAGNKLSAFLARHGRATAE